MSTAHYVKLLNYLITENNLILHTTYYQKTMFFVTLKYVLLFNVSNENLISQLKFTYKERLMLHKRKQLSYCISRPVEVKVVNVEFHTFHRSNNNLFVLKFN